MSSVILTLTAAQNFIYSYYDTLNKRKKLDTFYIGACPRYSAFKADISINGSLVATPADFETLLEKQGNGVRYEVESFDAHVVNPNFNLGAPDHLLGAEKSGAKSSVLAQVTGRVYYGRGRDVPQQGFNEVFVLVPNWDSFGRNAPRNPKRWLIMSQNFRGL
jgi:NTF2-related export protein 1/2